MGDHDTVISWEAETLPAKSSLCCKTWTIHLSTEKSLLVRGFFPFWSVKHKQRHAYICTHSFFLNFSSCLLNIENVWTQQHQFICTGTGSRTLWQVVNKDGGLVLNTKKRKTNNFFKNTYFIGCTKNNLPCWILQKLRVSFKAQREQSSFIINSEMRKKLNGRNAKSCCTRGRLGGENN